MMASLFPVKYGDRKDWEGSLKRVIKVWPLWRMTEESEKGKIFKGHGVPQGPGELETLNI